MVLLRRTDGRAGLVTAKAPRTPRRIKALV